MPKYNEYPEASIITDNDIFLILDAETGTNKQIKASVARAYLQTPAPLAGTFNWQSNGDTNGIIYAIGTNKGEVPFVNPHTSNKVINSMSSIGFGNIANITDRILQVNYTSNVAESWYEIDLKSQRVKPNRYTFRHDNNTGYYARSWQFQGSNDDENWTVLDIQTNNSSINTVGAWASVTVSGINTFYRYLRIVMTALNSSGTNEFCCSEIELYGELA